MVVVRELNPFPTMVGAALATVTELSGDYRIHLDHPPPYDALPVEAELAKGTTISTEIQKKVETVLKKTLGTTAQVRLLEKVVHRSPKAKRSVQSGAINE